MSYYRRALVATSALLAAAVTVLVASVGHAAPVAVGQYAEFSVAPTVTAASAYASGNTLGGLLTVPSVTQSLANNGGRIENVTLYSKSSQTAQVDVVACSQNPTATTVTDKTAVALSTTDFAKCRVITSLTTWTSLGTPSQATSGQLAQPFLIPSGQSLYFILVTRGTPTFTATTDLQLNFTVGY